MSSYDMTVVDEIRQRLDATYEEALAGLEESGGDLLGALAAVEARRARTTPGDGELIQRILQLASNGPLKALRVRMGRRLLREIPLEVGPLGTLAASLLAVVVSELVLEPVRGEPREGKEGAAGSAAAQAGGQPAGESARA